jgi:putative aldouronate transport system permease protein
MVNRKSTNQWTERALSVVNYTLVSIFALMCIYPFYYIVIYSISSPTDAARGIFLFPQHVTFITYGKIFARDDFLSSVIVSLARTALGTVICVVCSSMFAYLVTKKEMLFRKFVYRFVIITMYMSAGLIPWYLTMKMYGMKNNFLLYILPGAVNAFFLILVKTFIEQLPSSLEESAHMDGAGFFRVFFPLSLPIIATITVFCAVGQWNSWTDNYFLISDKRLQTLQLILYNYLNNAQEIANRMKTASLTGQMEPVQITPESVQMTIIVITVIPILMVYPLLQKYFAKGILMGAVKG